MEDAALKALYQTKARTYLDDAKLALAAMSAANWWTRHASKLLENVKTPMAAPVRLENIGWSLQDDCSEVGETDSHADNIGSTLVAIALNCHPRAYPVTPREMADLDEAIAEMAEIKRIHGVKEKP